MEVSSAVSGTRDRRDWVGKHTKPALHCLHQPKPAIALLALTKTGIALLASTKRAICREEKLRGVRSGSGDSECLTDVLFRLTNCADSLTLEAESPWRADTGGGFLPTQFTNLSLLGPQMPCQID